MRNERRRIKEVNLLSAYLDNALNAKQKQALEQRLLVEPALQAELQHLNQTKMLMQQLPRLRAPRNFTLTPEMVTLRKKKKQPAFSALRLATSLAAVLLVVLFGVDFILGGGVMSNIQPDAVLEMEVAQVASTENPEPLILWSQQSAGGGGGPEAYGMGGGQVAEEAPLMIEEEALPVEEFEEALPKEAPADELDQELSSDMAEDERGFSAESPQQINPILGINPDEGGKIIGHSGTAVQDQTKSLPWSTILPWLKIALAAIVIGGGLALLVLRIRRKRSI